MPKGARVQLRRLQVWMPKIKTVSFDSPLSHIHPVLMSRPWYADPVGKKKKRRLDASHSQTTDQSQLLLLQRDKSVLKDRFNISNDQAYEIARQRHRVRQTFGQLVVQHAYPAVKLQLPFVSFFYYCLSFLYVDCLVV